MDNHGKQPAIGLANSLPARRSLLAAYGFAVAVSGLTLLARLSLDPWLGKQSVLILFILPIIFSAFVGGLGPGLLATALCTLGSYHFLRTPENILYFEGSVDLWHWAILIVVGVLISFLTEALRRAQTRAEIAGRLHAITLASIGDAVITTDAQGGITFLNGEAERLTGWTNADAAGQPLPKIFHIVSQTTREPVENPVKKVFRTGTVVGLANHTVLIARDGREFVIDDSGAPIRQADGKIIGVVLVFRDSTEKKRAEAALRESQALYRTLVEQASEGIFLHDAEGRLLDVNERACASLGYSRAELLRLRVTDVEADFSPEEAREVAQQLQTGEFKTVNGRHRRKDGSTFPVEISLSLHRVRDEELTMALVRDVTERREYEEKMARAVSLLRATIESSASGILAVDTQGKIAAYNQRFLQLWNVPAALAEAAQDEALLEFARQQLADPEAALRRVREIYAQPEAESFETLAFKDGRVFERSSHPQRLGGKIIGRVWSFWDITERRRAETALRQERELLRTLVDLAPDFIFVKDTEGRYLVVNTSLAACYGQTPGEMLGHTDAAFLPAELAARFRSSELRAMAAAAFCTFEDTVCFPDGATRALMTNMVPFRDGQGNFGGLVGIGRDVTAQKAIEKSMRLQSVALEAAANSILITDHNGSIEWVNPAFTRSMGYTLAECLGKNPRDLVRSGRHDRKFYQHLWDTILAGQIWHGEMFNRHKDGSLLQEEMTITPLLDRENRTTHFIAIRQDITERKRLEEEFAREQARFKLIFDTVPVGIAFHTIHPDGQVTRTVNDAHLRICGLTRAEHDEPGIYTRITHPEDHEVQQRFIAQVNADASKQYSMEKRYLHPDGKVVWVVFSYQREIYPDGTAEELTTVVDITERKAVEQQLRQLATIVASSEDAIVSKNLDGVITSWNRGAEIIFGYAAGEAIGQPMLLLFPEELKPKETEIQSRIARGESVEHFETERLRKDGTRIRIAATISPLKDSQGNVVGASTIARDTTRQHLLEEQLRQSQKMEAIGQLAGGVAHDFNNILAVIQMQTELAKMDGHSSPDQLGCLDEIQIAASRAANLTRQLLLFSRRQRLRPHALDLSDSINSMAKMLRRVLGEDIQMHLKYAPQPLFIHADAGMMDQVLMNLTLNSRDAMPGGGELVIETTAVEFDATAAALIAGARPGGFVRLSVSDTGCGIPPAIQPRIFEPFFTTKEVGKGTGLGLATVFSIVQQHQGWISIASTPGQGTTFQIFLPRLAKTSAPPAAAALATASGGNETILLVEDDEALRASVRKTLGQLGYRLLEAANGAEALRIWKLHRNEIHLLLTDLVMPGGMSGKELAGRLRQEHPGLKVIYASGYSAEVAGKDFPLTEGVNFLAKPFPVPTLARTIRDCLDRT